MFLIATAMAGRPAPPIWKVAEPAAVVTSDNGRYRVRWFERYHEGRSTYTWDIDPTWVFERKKGNDFVLVATGTRQRRMDGRTVVQDEPIPCIAVPDSGKGLFIVWHRKKYAAGVDEVQWIDRRGEGLTAPLPPLLPSSPRVVSGYALVDDVLVIATTHPRMLRPWREPPHLDLVAVDRRLQPTEVELPDDWTLPHRFGPSSSEAPTFYRPSGADVATVLGRLEPTGIAELAALADERWAYWGKDLVRPDVAADLLTLLTVDPSALDPAWTKAAGVAAGWAADDVLVDPDVLADLARREPDVIEIFEALRRHPTGWPTLRALMDEQATRRLATSSLCGSQDCPDESR